jgi:hypothetical protein
MRRLITPLISLFVLSGSLVAGSAVATTAGAASTATCGSITKALVVADGYTAATTPVVTPYNYKKESANSANSLGTTIDFGAKALVVACVSPSDIAKLSAQAAPGKPVMTAAQYMTWMAKDSAGAMKATPVAGVTDYLDFGNGKEDGLGSTVKAGSVRLDAWVAGSYIFLAFSAPVTPKVPTPLVNFIHSTVKLY